MPELPEVETVVRGLAPHLNGLRIAHVQLHRRSLRTPLPDDFETVLKGRTLKAITRRAKYILMHLSGGKVLIVHLGMSGTLVLHHHKKAALRKHDHVTIDWEAPKKKDHWQLIFHDPRRFGLMAIAEERGLEHHPLLTKLGPEPLDKNVDGPWLFALLQKSKAPVKTLIMQQEKLVGVGNIYACEALFRARINPERAANKVSKKEAASLCDTIKAVLEEAIVSGGSTLRDYVRSSGDSGYFQHHFQVYGRAGKPCVVCKKPIAIIRQGGRSTFYCRHCQKK